MQGASCDHWCRSSSHLASILPPNQRPPCPPITRPAPTLPTGHTGHPTRPHLAHKSHNLAPGMSHNQRPPCPQITRPALPYPQVTQPAPGSHNHDPPCPQARQMRWAPMNGLLQTANPGPSCAEGCLRRGRHRLRQPPRACRLCAQGASMDGVGAAACCPAPPPRIAVAGRVEGCGEG